MTQPKTVLIKYIGKKDFFPDFVAQSGKNWNGYGDVQEVTAEQARKLLVHDDEFAVKDAHDALLVKQEEERAAFENAEPGSANVDSVEGLPETVAQAEAQESSAPEGEAQAEQAATEKPTAEEIAAFNKIELLALSAAHAVEVNDAAPVVTLRKQLIEALHPTA